MDTGTAGLADLPVYADASFMMDVAEISERYRHANQEAPINDQTASSWMLGKTEPQNVQQG